MTKKRRHQQQNNGGGAPAETAAAEAAPALPASPAADAPLPIDPSSWAAGWGRGRKRALLVFVQASGQAALLAAGVALAYLMTASWPQSMAPVDRTVLNFPALFLRLLRSPEFRPFFPLVLIVPVIRLLIFQWAGLYQANLGDTRPFRAATTILRGVVLGTALLALLGAAYQSVYPDAARHQSVLMFMACEGIIAFFAVLLWHSATLIGVLFLHAFGFWRTRVVIIHDGAPPDGLITALRSPSTEYDYMGEVLAGPGTDYEGQVPGDIGALKALINRHNLDEVILAVDPGTLSAQQRLEVAQTCWRMGAQIKMCTPFQPYFRTNALPDMAGDFPLLRVQNLGLYATFPQLGKRLMDMALSAAAIVALSPLMALVAVLIKLDSPGPVFFIQERVGLNGRTFRMIKFRSMRADSDPEIHKKYLQQMIKNGQEYELDADGKPVYKMTNDPRITRLGRFIRKTSIDELPQFFNVFKGDMSLVGPRPPIQYEVDEYKDWHMKRLYIRPGITGLWQVSGRNRLSFDQMVQLDIAYIEQWSLWMDLKILFRTIPVVLHLDQAF